MKKEILFFIFKFEGLTNDHLRSLIYGSEDINVSAQKASICRFIVQLRKEGFVESDVCLPYGGKLHFLKQKGIDAINETHEINPRHPYAGYHGVHGDFKEALLRVNKSNLNKHMIFVDFAIKLINNGFYVRNRYYCVKHYQMIVDNVTIAKKIRPFGEFTKKLGNKPYVIEIIRYTEEYTELVEKFKAYVFRK